MTKITSVKNPLIQSLRKLKDKQGRKEQGLFLAEGDVLVREAFAADREVRYVLTTEEALPQDIADGVKERGAQLLQVTDPVMKSVCDTKTPQCMAAIVTLPHSTAGPMAETKGVWLLLDGVADPGNVGTMIRTADAVGAAGVALSDNCADAYSPKVVRAAMGSHFHLPVLVQMNLPEAVSCLKKQGYLIAGTHLSGESILDKNTVLCEKTAFLFGNEARGLSETLSEKADVLLKLPMYGRAESLNVSIACGVFLYAWAAQNKQ
jgi:TrmH family RNA methyltransferase